MRVKIFGRYTDKRKYEAKRTCMLKTFTRFTSYLRVTQEFLTYEYVENVYVFIAQEASKISVLIPRVINTVRTNDSIALLVSTYKSLAWGNINSSA